MKITITTILAALFATTAFAGPFGLPDHQQDGYRDTGCDPEQRTEIRNDAGDLLYTNNPTCPDVGGSASLADFIAAYEAAFPAPEEDDEPVLCKGCEIATK